MTPRYPTGLRPRSSRLARRLGRLTIHAASVALLAGGTAAQAAWPERPIKLVTGFTAGGGADGVARAVGEALGRKLGQPVVVENRPGAGTTLAAATTAKAAPDGYTLMLLTTTNAISPAMYNKLPYNAAKDFTLVGSVARGPMLIGVAKTSSIHSLQDLIAQARKSPGKLNYGAGGVGTTPHLAALVLQREASMTMTHIPYKGGSETAAALIGGQIQVQFGTPPAMAPLASRTRFLAVTTSQRTSLVPGVPSVAETVKGYDVMSWYGLAGPAGLSSDVVTTLAKVLGEVLQDDVVRKHLGTLGLEPYTTSPADTAKIYLSELQRWANVIKQEGLRADE